MRGLPPQIDKKVYDVDMPKITVLVLTLEAPKGADKTLAAPRRECLAHQSYLKRFLPDNREPRKTKKAEKCSLLHSSAFCAVSISCSAVTNKAKTDLSKKSD